MNVTLVPYGNAKTSGKEVKCQHGEEECEGNMWENCAIKLNPEFSDYFPFIHCMEKASSKMLDEVRRCARTSGILVEIFQNKFELSNLAWGRTSKDWIYEVAYHF